jgi:hypothetical protein
MLLLLPSSTAVLILDAIMQHLRHVLCAVAHCNCCGLELAVLLKWQGA